MLDLPNDVHSWVLETYTDVGVEIWLRAWQNTDDDGREHMAWLARMAGGGS